LQKWGRNALRPHFVIAHLSEDVLLAPAARHLRSPYISYADVGAGGKAKYVLATFLTDVQQLSKMVTKPHYTSLWNPHLQTARIPSKRQTNAYKSNPAYNS